MTALPISEPASEDEIRDIVRSPWPLSRRLIEHIQSIGATGSQVREAYASSKAIKRKRPTDFAAAKVFDLLVAAHAEDLSASLLEGLRDDGWKD